MAKYEIGPGLDEISDKLAKLEGQTLRQTVRRIVDAGAAADAKNMRQRIQEKRHIRTGEMLEAVGSAEYKEFFGGGQEYVYPQGDDSSGAGNALKAYVINCGRGRKPTKAGTPNRTGDKFITGRFSQTEEIVRRAMAAEAEKAFQEMGL